MACQTGLAECQDLTSTWFRQWMDDPQHNRWVCWLHVLNPVREPAITDCLHQDSTEPAFGCLLRRRGSRRCSRLGLWLVAAAGGHSSQRSQDPHVGAGLHRPGTAAAKVC